MQSNANWLAEKCIAVVVKHLGWASTLVSRKGWAQLKNVLPFYLVRIMKKSVILQCGSWDLGTSLEYHFLLW